MTKEPEGLPPPPPPSRGLFPGTLSYGDAAASGKGGELCQPLERRLPPPPPPLPAAASAQSRFAWAQQRQDPEQAPPALGFTGNILPAVPTSDAPAPPAAAMSAADAAAAAAETGSDSTSAEQIPYRISDDLSDADSGPVPRARSARPPCHHGKGSSDDLEMARVKFLCSFGGAILPRPSDGRLRYVGGDTRVISVSRNISYADLLAKLINVHGQAVTIKYQLPDEDLDALVTVSSSDDLVNLMEEYDLLESREGMARLRLFLFPAADPEPVPQASNTHGRESASLYVEALNGQLGAGGQVAVDLEASAHVPDGHRTLGGDALPPPAAVTTGAALAHQPFGPLLTAGTLQLQPVPGMSQLALSEAGGGYSSMDFAKKQQQEKAQVQPGGQTGGGGVGVSGGSVGYHHDTLQQVQKKLQALVPHGSQGDSALGSPSAISSGTSSPQLARRWLPSSQPPSAPPESSHHLYLHPNEYSSYVNPYGTDSSKMQARPEPPPGFQHERSQSDGFVYGGGKVELPRPQMLPLLNLPRRDRDVTPTHSGPSSPTAAGPKRHPDHQQHHWPEALRPDPAQRHWAGRGSTQNSAPQSIISSDSWDGVRKQAAVGGRLQLAYRDGLPPHVIHAQSTPGSPRLSYTDSQRKALLAAQIPVGGGGGGGGHGLQQTYADQLGRSSQGPSSGPSMGSSPDERRPLPSRVMHSGNSTEDQNFHVDYQPPLRPVVSAPAAAGEYRTLDLPEWGADPGDIALLKRDGLPLHASASAPDLEEHAFRNRFEPNITRPADRLHIPRRNHHLADIEEGDLDGRHKPTGYAPAVPPVNELDPYEMQDNAMNRGNTYASTSQAPNMVAMPGLPPLYGGAQFSQGVGLQDRLPKVQLHQSLLADPAGQHGFPIAARPGSSQMHPHPMPAPDLLSGFEERPLSPEQRLRYMGASAGYNHNAMRPVQENQQPNAPLAPAYGDRLYHARLDVPHRTTDYAGSGEEDFAPGSPLGSPPWSLKDTTREGHHLYGAPEMESLHSRFYQEQLHAGLGAGRADVGHHQPPESSLVLRSPPPSAVQSRMGSTQVQTAEEAAELQRLQQEALARAVKSRLLTVASPADTPSAAGEGHPWHMPSQGPEVMRVFAEAAEEHRLAASAQRQHQLPTPESHVYPPRGDGSSLSMSPISPSRASSYQNLQLLGSLADGRSSGHQGQDYVAKDHRGHARDGVGQGEAQYEFPRNLWSPKDSLQAPDDTIDYSQSVPAAPLVQAGPKGSRGGLSPIQQQQRLQVLPPIATAPPAPLRSQATLPEHQWESDALNEQSSSDVEDDLLMVGSKPSSDDVMEPPTFALHKNRVQVDDFEEAPAADKSQSPVTTSQKQAPAGSAGQEEHKAEQDVTAGSTAQASAAQARQESKRAPIPSTTDVQDATGLAALDLPFTSLLDKEDSDGPLGTAAEEEAVAHGLQTIKNADLEELKELGSGTFGTVYHGKWRGTDVAIKRIKASVFQGRASERDRLVADFWKEASMLAALHHPNVVAFYGVVKDGPGGTLATVTEYMVNGSLKQVLHKKERTIDRKKRVLIAMDAAFGMEYLHTKNIVHFDLKCDNLLVNLRDTQRPICKVGDLGLSKIKHKTMVSGGVRGTLPWMAPELLDGRSSLVTEKVDVFSFGIVMWELLTGDEPYTNMHYGAIIGGILNDTLRPPVPHGCHPPWKDLMERCWANSPEKRPSFSEIAAELRAMSLAK
eukprot:SM000152S01546  [mRNA]  locus=s152:153740:161065:- [translate_table: standard]